jgi:hypothetical protein
VTSPTLPSELRALNLDVIESDVDLNAEIITGSVDLRWFMWWWFADWGTGGEMA